MSSFALGSRGRRLALSVGGALAAAIIAAPTASAQFTLAECQGGLAPGQGATFQNSAFNGFKAVYSQEAPNGCGSAAGNNVTWTGTGSGAGRAALGSRESTNPTGQRDPGYRWAGADEPPNPQSRLWIEAGPIDGNGQDLTAADNGRLHVIPVAIGAIAALVHLPDGCTGFGAGAELYQQRPKIQLEDFEAAWFGEPTTWGDLIPTLEPDDGTCRDAPVKRVVRRDSSGSTFAFKQLLFNINPSHTDWRILGNQSWPNQDTNPVTPGASDGGGALGTALNTTSGGIGYLDLATARSTANKAFQYDSTEPFDNKFWLPLQVEAGEDVWADPQAAVTGYEQNSTARGANCASVNPKNVPASPSDDPTLGDWSITDSTLSGNGYAACTLTYDMAFDDNAVVYCNSAEEQAKARTVKDYLTKGIISTAGQQSLTGSDYAPLPTAIALIAKHGIDQIGWNKGGQGRPCSDQPEPTPTPTATPAGPSTTDTPPPPPVAPSNAFTISSTRVSGTTVRLQLQLPGAGRVSVSSTTKPKKAKTIKLATKRANVTKAGRTTINLTLSAKAKKALRKDKRLKIAMKVTFTPTGGTAKTVSKSVTVKQPKAKAKSKSKSRS